jgi:hypothetical protein
MTEAEALEFSVGVIRKAGLRVGDYDESAGTLIAIRGDEQAVINLRDPAWTRDKESTRRYVEQVLGMPPENKWTPYLNHAVLVKCNQDRTENIRDVRVEAFSPSGKYVRFVGLSENISIWAPVDHYDLLEDLGERLPVSNGKPVLPRR